MGLASTVSWLRAERLLEHYWRGRWQEALAGAEQRLAESEAGSPTEADIVCRYVRGWIRLARRELAGALVDATAAVELGRSTGFGDLAPALALQAQVLSAAGRLVEADKPMEDLFGLLATRGARPTAPDWAGPLAYVLRARGRPVDLVDLLARAPVPTPWLQAAAAVAAGDDERAADLYAEIGSLPDEAFSRLQAAAGLRAAGRHDDADAHLRRAVAFFRRVRASAHLQEAKALQAPPASSA